MRDFLQEEKAVYLKINYRQIRCSQCENTFTERNRASGPEIETIPRICVKNYKLKNISIKMVCYCSNY